ncbi:MAG: GBS Bsp-like repeat-containing protein [Coriobacteriia bacterium]|nr:GBS Bsp-like repeat-containing protein [Coriobacteriia bacterium]MCL2749767.1 GBS Bsp-like repeat-containing protein [Coriobacteriia bacterium]
MPLGKDSVKKVMACTLSIVLAAMLALPYAQVFAEEVQQEQNPLISESLLAVEKISISNRQLAQGETQKITVNYLQATNAPAHVKLRIENLSTGHTLSLDQTEAVLNSLVFEFCITSEFSLGDYRLIEITYQLLEDETEHLINVRDDLEQEFIFTVLEVIETTATVIETPAEIDNQVSEIVSYAIQPSVSVLADHTWATLTLRAQDVPAATSAVHFPVWASPNQSDIIWYPAQRQANGSWQAGVPVRYHSLAGTYHVHVYATVSGALRYLGANTFSIASFTPTVAIQNNAGTTFDVVVSSNTPSGLSSVRVPVWSTPNQSNLVWYTATRQANGTFRATVNVANHGFATGTYQVHVYATAGNGVAGTLATTTATTILSPVNISATVASNQMHASIRVSGGLLAQASSVVVPVWRSANQGDLVWYPAQRQADGSWIATATIANHRLAGTYTAHAYATIAGSFNYVAPTTFNITTFTPTIAIQNNVGTTFDVVVSSLTPSGLSAVRVPVWSTPNQSNLVWYTATRQANGTYRATVNVANHGFATGTYQVHVYATAGNGTAGTLAATTVTTNLAPITMTATVTPNQMHASIRVSGGLLAQASSVVVPVWRSPNQSDLVWYPAQRQADGSWVATAAISNHRLAGTYTAHAYATIAGSFNYVAPTTFSIASFTPTVAVQNNSGATFDVVVSPNTPSGLSAVRVPVWSTPNQSNLVWYTATRQADGTYRATVSVANHGFATGTYQIHVYATAGNGVVGTLATTTAATSIPTVNITATVTPNQMHASIRVSGGLFAQASSVVVPVWASSNQSDLVWYPAQRQADGSWIATVTIANHRLAGTYIAHAYATISGSQGYFGATTFTITKPTATVAISNVNQLAGTFDVVVSNISSPSGVSYLQVPVWSSPSQFDIIWYSARNMGNGTWIATVDARYHSMNISAPKNYHAHVYLVSGNGMSTMVGASSVAFQYQGSGIDPWLDAQLRHIVAVCGYDLRACFNYVTRFPYFAMSLWPTGSWEIPFAREMIANGGGNCYRYAALFCMLARYLGYDTRPVAGTVASYSTGHAAHGWVEIYLNGTLYVCDPTFGAHYPGYNWYMNTYANAPAVYYR